VSEEVYDELLTINAKFPYFTFAKRGKRRLTFVANLLGIPMIGTYAASKAALLRTRSLARELLRGRFASTR